MSKIFTSLLAFAAGLTAVSALPQFSDLESRASTGNFSLFAFGDAPDTTIGGFPIFYHDGAAYIADPAKVDKTTDYAVFEKNSSATTQWIANPLTPSNKTTLWENSILYVTSPAGPMGFYINDGISNTSTGNLIMDGFTFYGTTAMLKVDGVLETLWYAVTTDIDGLWTVGWNATGGGVEDSAELLTIRKVTAGNVEYPATFRE